MNKLSGTIRKYSSEYSVYCARCSLEQVEHWHNQKAMELSLRRQGWSKKVEGWVCPKCCGSNE